MKNVELGPNRISQVYTIEEMFGGKSNSVTIKSVLFANEMMINGYALEKAYPFIYLCFVYYSTS